MLTSRELQVAKLVGQGMSNKEIARELDVKESTVKMHLHNSYAKLGINGRMRLAIYIREKQDA